MIPLPPRLYYPRCKVLLSCLLEGNPVPATFSAIPISVEVERNSARKADTARIELDYRDFPIDPRGISSIHVSIHMENSRTANAPMAPTPLNKRFIGLVDEPRTTLSEATNTVRMECRDYTGIWLDYRWPTQLKVGAISGPSLPTPQGTTLQLAVEYMRGIVTPLTKPAIFTDPTAKDVDIWLRTGKEAFASDEDENAWDVLSALCDLFGLVPVWNLDQLEIRSPTEPKATQAFMVYGRNVERLEFRRNLKRNKGKQVKIVGWNPFLGVATEAVWPTEALIAADGQHTKLSEGGKPKTRIEQVQYNVEGPYTYPDLLLIAKSVHAELSQNELQGTLETRDMTDMAETGLLGLQNGDVLFVDLGPEDHAAISAMSPAEAIAHLSNPTRANSIDPTVAAALVQSWQTAQRSSQFYVLEAAHRWDRGDGYRLQVKFRDFILG